MLTAYILKGLIIGLTVSAPMGPIAVFCLQRTLNKGVWIGFISGLGAAFADTVYAAIAGFGLSIISDFLTEQQFYIRGIGGIFLIIVGVKVFYTNTIKQARKQKVNKGRLLGDFASVFFLTLSNPITVIFFGAVFAGIGLAGEGGSTYLTFLTVAGVLVGAMLWWLLLAFIINLFRHKIRLRSIWWINKIAGALIVILGIGSVVSLLFVEKLGL